MLQDIFDSKTDSAVLGFYLAAPARAFSVLEIAKRLKLGRQKAVHSLNKLAGEGLLAGFSKKGKKYFLANSRQKIFCELKGSFQKDNPPYKDELFSALKNLGEVKAAFLSGLFTGQPALPVDLLLVGKVNLNKLDQFLKNAEKLMGQEINYSIMSVPEFQLRRDTFDKFIRDIFDYPHLAAFNLIVGKKKSS